MTPEHEQALAEGRARAAKERQKKAQTAEREFQARISATPGIDPEDVRKLDYIHREIMSGRRDPADVDYLKQTRTHILRPYKIQEEDA